MVNASPRNYLFLFHRPKPVLCIGDILTGVVYLMRFSRSLFILVESSTASLYQAG